MRKGFTTPESSASADQEKGPVTAAETGSNSSEAETAVAAYLHALKGASRNSKRDSGAATAAGRQTVGAPGGCERRRSIRYKCNGSAEFRVEGSEVRTWGALQDISLHGCYVEATAISPVGTILNMVLEVNRIRVRVKGEVRVSYPSMGMGISYTEVVEEERVHLRKLLSSLSESPGVTGLSPGKVAAGVSQPVTLPITDAAAAISAIIQFFQSRSMLSRQDFWEVVRKSQTAQR